jgi:hypothetical protein
VLDGPTSDVNGADGGGHEAGDGQVDGGDSISVSDKEGSDGDGAEGDAAGMSEKEAAEIAGDAALQAEAALHADSAAEEEADTTAAAEQIEVAAAAAAAALPDHLRLLFERPYLKNLIVDVWSAATSAVEAAAAATATAAISTGADVPAAAVSVGGSLSEQEQQQALINIAAHGGLEEAAAEVQAPPIPDIYFKPLHEAEEAAAAQTEEAKKVKKRVARHLTTASEEDLQQLEDEDLQLERLEHQLEEAVKAASAAAGSVGGLHPGSMRQQKRQLLRHMWTGGGGRRGMISIAPKQETVTAAVQAWLSNTTGSTGSSSGSSSSKEATLNAAMASAGVQMGRLTSEADGVLLQHLVEQGLGEVPEGKARRPRIFVYDMPSR